MTPITLMELAQLAMDEAAFRDRFRGSALVFSSQLHASEVTTTEPFGNDLDAFPDLTDKFPLHGRKRSLEDTVADAPDVRELLAAAKTGARSVVVFLDSLYGRGAALFESPVLVGRGPTNHIRLRPSTVSINQSMLLPSKEGWTVRDLDSANGTYVDGREIASEPVTLTSGAWISFGPEIHARFVPPTALREMLESIVRH